MPKPAFSASMKRFSSRIAILLLVAFVAGCKDDGASPLDPPTLGAITPATVVLGSTVTATLTGTNFVEDGTEVSIDDPAIDVRDVAVRSSTELTATLVIGLTATVGARTVEVETDGGRAAAALLSVIPAPPTAGAETPLMGGRGGVATITLTGTNFVVGETTVTANRAGLTVTGVTVASATSLTATVAIDSDAELGTYMLQVSTPGGTSAGIEFEVIAQPTLKAMTPSTGEQGTTVTATLNGTGFVTGLTQVTVQGTGVSADEAVASGRSLTVELTIASDAPVGEREVTVTTPGGTTDALVFTVLPTAPTLTGVTPNTGMVGSTVDITLSGTGFLAGSTSLTVGGSGVTVSNLNVVDDASLTATLTIAPDAATGTRNITVTTANGTSNSVTFTIVLEPPTLTSIDPAVGFQGATVPVTLTGSHFVPGGTSVVVSGSGVTVSDVTLLSSTSLTATLTIAPGAAPGARSVTVATVAGQSAPLTFDVLGPGRFVYVANEGSNTITQYSIDPATGALTPNGAPVAASDAFGVAVTPSGKFVYVTSWGFDSIQMYTVDSSGQLVANGSVAAFNAPRNLVVDPTERWVYAVNQLSGSISMYGINADGTLTTMGAAVPSGTQPVGIAMDPLGRYLYTVDVTSNVVLMYRINSDGTLTANVPATVPTGATPLSIAVEPTGRYAYVGHSGTNRIGMYAIQADGTLSSLGTFDFPDVNSRPSGLTVDPTGRFLYAVDSNTFINQVRAFRIAANGSLVDLGAVATGVLPREVAVEPGGRFAYVVNQGSGTISVYEIQADGTLTAVETEPTGSNPFDLGIAR